MDNVTALVVLYTERHHRLQVDDKLEKHPGFWKYKTYGHWHRKIHEELLELDAAIAGLHDDPVHIELVQLASLSINWLRLMVERGDLSIHTLQEDLKRNMREHNV